MTVIIKTGSKFGEHGVIANKLFAEDPTLEKKLDNFRENSEWFFDNEEDLREEYGGCHIAVYEKKVCLAEKDQRKLIKSVRTKYGDDPSVMTTFIGKEKVNFLL